MIIGNESLEKVLSINLYSTFAFSFQLVVPFTNGKYTNSSGKAFRQVSPESIHSDPSLHSILLFNSISTPCKSHI